MLLEIYWLRLHQQRQRWRGVFLLLCAPLGARAFFLSVLCGTRHYG
jgi:hypothetical protein